MHVNIHAQMPSTVATYYILDFDRCLGDVEALNTLWAQTLEACGVMTAEAFYRLRAAVEASGGSFDSVEYLLDTGRLDVAGYEQVAAKYLAAADASALRMSGATELLALLDTRGDMYGIVTYGGARWQSLKLRAAGVDTIPHLITPVKRKGRLFDAWWQQDGSFQLPAELGGAVASSLVLIDDKAISFEGFPPLPSKGYYVCDLAAALPAQKGSVPDNVTQVPSIEALLPLLAPHP